MIKHELTIFLAVGATTVLIDFAAYRGLVGFGLMNVDLAKATGFIVGTVFAYFANRFWTFGKKSHAPGSAWRFVLLYACTLGANVLVNWSVLQFLDETTTGVQFAFLAATGVSAVLNFFGMKHLVFHQRRTAEFS